MQCVLAASSAPHRSSKYGGTFSSGPSLSSSTEATIHWAWRGMCEGRRRQGGFAGRFRMEPPPADSRLLVRFCASCMQRQLGPLSPSAVLGVLAAVDQEWHFQTEDRGMGAGNSGERDYKGASLYTLFSGFVSVLCSALYGDAIRGRYVSARGYGLQMFRIAVLGISKTRRATRQHSMSIQTRHHLALRRVEAWRG